MTPRQTKHIRRLVQIVALLLFAALLVATTWPLRSPLSVQVFLRADPLSGLAAALSPYRSWALLGLFWPALALLAATAPLGRFFCGWLCPLGTCIDGADALLRRWRPKKAARLSCRPKYYLLALVLAAAIFGTHLFWVLDPIPLLTRTCATTLFPASAQAYDTAIMHARPLLRAWGWRLQPLPPRPFVLSTLTGWMFAIILLLGLVRRRYWCRSLCPLGALLGLVARYGGYRRRVADTCTHCGRCSRDCKMAAISAADPAVTDQAECVQCHDCDVLCLPQSIHFNLTREPEPQPAPDLGRRQFLAIVAAGASYGAVARYGLLPRPASDRLLRPPGAIVRDPAGGLRMMTEDEFRSQCLRCGQCLKACVTGGLQPAVTEAGLDGFYTPRLVPRVGWCEFGCAACGQVCPSGALVPFVAEEKKRILIGLAGIDRGRCLAWQPGGEYRQCLVCDEHCSYDAIHTRHHDGEDRPFVDERLCTGCGICEHACPVRPEAAIAVRRRQA